MKRHDTLRLILTTDLSDRQVAAAAGTGATTVRRYRRVARAKRLTWEQVASLPPQAVLDLLNPPRHGKPRKADPDWAALHQQMQGKGTTLQLLWEDYWEETAKTGLCYSQFAARYKAFRETLPSIMRQHHVPGERAFVDYSGVRPHLVDRATGQRRPVELFVGVLPSSGLFFALATTSQKVPDWVAAHVAMFDYFGGVPSVVVPDNLRSAVTKAGREPVLQRSYADMARHYGVAIIPARPGHPRDKGAVEQAVRFAQQRILARVRSQAFYSLDELNAAIRTLLDEANGRPMSKDGQSRRARFEASERAALNPMPKAPYVFGEWVSIERVPRDYHVPVLDHFYSVPHHLVGQRVDARVTASHVELFHQRQCVGRHARSTEKGAHTTLPSHRTPEHRAQAERSPTDMKAWAAQAGPSVVRFVHKALGQARPFEGMKACDAVRGLAHKHGDEAVDAALAEAFSKGSPTATTVKRLLANRTRPKAPAAARHGNVQGAQSYLGGG